MMQMHNGILYDAEKIIPIKLIKKEYVNINWDIDPFVEKDNFCIYSYYFYILEEKRFFIMKHFYEIKRTILFSKYIFPSLDDFINLLIKFNLYDEARQASYLLGTIAHIKKKI